MTWRNLLIYGFVVIFAKLTWADITVQLNINRPINDVSDKFISFTMKPEDLYKALDGPDRKTITRMASMLSHSHVKFVGDYYFAAEADTKLRNPTKIVWKGFNKWTKAVNWSMIIPVPYTPNNWDPMQALKILNSSQMVGISDCIWQLGTDFGSSGALDYVTELKTFNIMVDSFRDSVNSWQIMGADISAGSSPDETRRYVDMSRDLNAAYGWIQSGDMTTNSLNSPQMDHDPALKVLFKENVPVWLTLPTPKAASSNYENEVAEGLSWAQTMGNAANMGFESIFKPLALSDFEKPNYSFYVTALFKKIMGSRVYPARPLGVFGRTNKLYTHCANSASGGLAFMVVNKQERPLQIAIRSMSKIQETELWQYALTVTNGQIMLNNKRLTVNSTLMPEVRRKHAQSMLQLKTPGMSVSFWVLPNVNLDHCQYTEVETPVFSEVETVPKYKRYSSTDRLLKELIKESSKSPDLLGSLMKRQRRAVANDDRYKRFVLEAASKDQDKPLKMLTETVVEDIKTPLKRDIFSPERRKAAMDWLGNIFKQPLNLDIPLLKRNARDTDSYNGPYFMTRDGKKTAFTKKISEIKKPEKKVNKFLYEDQEFDEEKFFKNVGIQPEPDYVRFPEGDIFLKDITSSDGENVQEEMKIETKQNASPKTATKEIVSEMKPLRLLPTEFFEALPSNPVKPTSNKFGSALNSLLFSEPFGKQFGKLNKNIFSKNYDLKEDPITPEIEDDRETNKDMDIELDNNNDDFVQAQIDMSQNALHNKAKQEQEDEEEDSKKDVDDLLESPETKPTESNKNFFSDFMSSSNFNFFGDSSKTNEDEKSSQTESLAKKPKFEELPWWDLTPLRMKRALDTRYSANHWRNNMITKNDDPITAANEMSSKRFGSFEYKVDEAVRSTNDNVKDNEDSIGKRIVNSFKDQVSKFVDILKNQVSDWYNTLSKQLEGADVEATTAAYRIV